MLQKLQRWLHPDRLLDVMLRMSSHRGLSLKRLIKNPHGQDLGALVPMLPARLFTRTGRIDLAPAPYVKDVERVRGLVDAAPTRMPTNGRGPLNGELQLIGRRHLRSNNSWLHHSYRLVKGPNRCTVMMHPEDAERRSLHDGQEVEVTSEVGAIRLPLEVSAAVMPGVISIPHGWGHDDENTSWPVAQAHPGANVNKVTDHRQVDALIGTAAVNGQWVRVAAVDAHPLAAAIGPTALQR